MKREATVLFLIFINLQCWAENETSNTRSNLLSALTPTTPSPARSHAPLRSSSSTTPPLTDPPSSRSHAPLATRTAQPTTSPSTSSTTTTATVRNCNAPDTVCLMGGKDGDENFSGNVMVGGAPVCDDSWELQDATVACRELGFFKAKQFTRESRFGNVSSSFRMDDVKCRGDEAKLVDCIHTTVDDCGSGEAAGVICDTRDYSDIMNTICFEMDISYTFGDSIDQANNIHSVTACQEYCQEVEGCSHFTFYPDLSRCYRKRGNAKTFKEGAISGPRNCSMVLTTPSPTSTDCYESGVGYTYGEYLDYFSDADAQSCQARCQGYNGCNFFSYYNSNSECYMKSSNTEKRINSDVTSGPKHCEGNSTLTTISPDGRDSYGVTDACRVKNKLCLIGGTASHEGNLYIGGKPVCDDSWDMTDGKVVCRELGFYEIVRITRESQYGLVPDMFALDNVGCEGSESNLTDCPASEINDCGTGEGAGVVCDTRSQAEIEAEKELTRACFEDGVSYDFGVYVDFDVSDNALGCQKHCQAHADCTHFTFYKSTSRCYRKTGNSKNYLEGATSGPRNCSDAGYVASFTTTEKSCSNQNTICLAGGSKPSEGNVMIGNKPVCDDDWTLVNANVACKELGYVGALAFTKESRFGSVDEDFAMDQVHCDGTEERLIDCSHISKDDCGIGEGAGVICNTRSRLEIQQDDCFSAGVSYSPGHWLDYEVVPSPLDCQTHCRAHAECTYFTFYSDTNKCYRKTSNTVILQRGEALSGPRDCPNNNTNTTGSGLTSTTAAPRDCSTSGVVCLRGGSSPAEGNVFVGGKPVCDDEWDRRDGLVTCLELGFQDVIMTYSESQFGEVSNDFSMDNVECVGTESSLKLCRHSRVNDCGVGEGAGVKCDTRKAVQVPSSCEEHGSLCLLGGEVPHEGNVYVEGKPVCDDGWMMSNAVVICKQLGYKEALGITKESRFGIVPPDFYMTGVTCVGTEQNILNCPNSKRVNCNRQEGAGVRCSRLKVGEEEDSTGLPVLPVLLVGLLVAGLVFSVWRWRERIGLVLSREVMIRSSGNHGLLSG